MTIELDFEVNGITNYDADIISCISTKKESTDKEISVGFKLVGDSVKLYSNQKNGYGTQGALTNIKIVEGQRTKISFVIEGNVAEGSAEYDSYFPMCYTYINGILSNAVMYDKTDSFN
jgi:hypothetical protein